MYRLRWEAVYHTGAVSSEGSVKKRLVIKILEQRIARRRFYLKNGFTSADIFVEGAGGDMEILNFGGKVSPEDYMRLQKYALGRFLFSLSGMRIVEPARA